MKGSLHKHSRAGKVLVVCCWLGLILFLLFNRDKFTVENIVSFTPKNPLLAFAVMMGLYTVKGCTVLTNGNVLYAAAGILFSLPLAVGVNIAGSVVVVTIPYWIGRKGGAETLEKLTERYKKLEKFRDAPKRNAVRISFLLRVLGVLPCEIISMYLGACKLRYRGYLLGSLTGMLPSIIAFTIMGAYISDPVSPQFLMAAAIWLLGSCIGLVLSYKEKTKKKRGE